MPVVKFGSVFSGIGGLDLGFVRAGMICSWQVEIDRQATTILERRFPDAERFADVRSVGRYNLKPVDIICGGFPCQDISLAGRRAGLAGEQSGLWFEFRRVIEETVPQWVVVENVPGLLSSNGGRDFATILRGMVKCGYGVAWRILDSQYFGVAQIRRRVFVIGSLGNGRAAQVLFERDSSARDITPGKKAGDKVAGTISTSLGDNIPGKAKTLMSGYDRYDPTAYTYIWQNKQQSGEIRIYKDKSPTMSTYWGTGGGNVPYTGVRQLTPLECERLQGFPDGWTDGQSDSARYRQLGNAVTVSVAEWIAKRIMELA
jgi:DNA (cytosine-5)-methyltransferase 1